MSSEVYNSMPECDHVRFFDWIVPHFFSLFLAHGLTHEVGAIHVYGSTLSVLVSFFNFFKVLLQFYFIYTLFPALVFEPLLLYLGVCWGMMWVSIRGMNRVVIPLEYLITDSENLSSRNYLQAYLPNVSVRKNSGLRENSLTCKAEAKRLTTSCRFPL